MLKKRMEGKEVIKRKIEKFREGFGKYDFFKKN